MKYIASVPAVMEVIKKYHLKQVFDDLADKLNNYVHGNGKAFYNETYRLAQGVCRDMCNSFCKELELITVSFLMVLVVITPLSVMSSDYLECLDNGDVPSEGMQYWVAPFVDDYLSEHKGAIHVQCIEYLKEITGMQFTC